MTVATTLGRTNLIVPRLGVGAMTWGDPQGIGALNSRQAGLRRSARSR